jgi:hypothetical protein
MSLCRFHYHVSVDNDKRIGWSDQAATCHVLLYPVRVAGSKTILDVDVATL